MDTEIENYCWDDETYPFEPRDYHPIPQKAIMLLLRRGKITLPITPEQEQALDLLRYVWSEKVFLRFKLAELEKRERLLLAEYPRYGRVERYLLSLFLRNDKKYTVGEASALVVHYLKVNVAEAVVKKVRQSAYDYKKPRAGKARKKLQKILTEQG